jgi:hypothetical protein
MKIKLILDNNGRTFDRYSVYFTDGTFLSLSSNCNSPQGFSQFGEWSEIPSTDNSNQDDVVEEKEISFSDLPISVQQHIKQRMKE